MHKLTVGPSKAKNGALARMVLILVCVFFPVRQAECSDILIRSGEQSDTIMQVGPGVGDEDGGPMRIESNPDNGTLMQVTPTPRADGTEPYLGPIFITPEIRTKEK